jgi:hypothetical protein
MTSRDDYINLQCWTLHLDTIKGPWIWFIDCANMEFHHSITKQFATVFANILMDEHSKLLRRIVVLNPNVWFHGVMHSLTKSIASDILDSIWYARSDMELLWVHNVLDTPRNAMSWLKIARTVNPNRQLEKPDDL